MTLVLCQLIRLILNYCLFVYFLALPSLYTSFFKKNYSSNICNIFFLFFCFSFLFFCLFVCYFILFFISRDRHTKQKKKFGRLKIIAIYIQLFLHTRMHLDDLYHIVRSLTGMVKVVKIVCAYYRYTGYKRIRGRPWRQD